MEWHEASYSVSDDPARLDARAIHDYLSQSYWASGIPLATVQRSLANSLSLGLYVTASGEQVGLARVITDRATFAYLCDVYVLEPHRGRGLSKFLMRCVRAHPDLQQLRRMMLVTADGHGLYAQFGFQPLSHPERVMESHDPAIYSQRATEHCSWSRADERDR